ncbi:hypothetical protein H2203_004441 [Taxawa tesnikishii (nom. ined.)]|nr:hypothetical protein H2203_004441 [Dothideales sp. JES 119]
MLSLIVLVQFVCFLAVTFGALKAVEAARRLLARRKHGRRDAESPPSPAVKPSSGEKHSVSEKSIPEIHRPNAETEGMEKIKELYYKLQNLEQYPDILPECRDLLIQLFSETLAEAQRDRESNILSVEHYTREALAKFLRTGDDATTQKWEEYNVRRRAGAPRDMFKDEEEAKWWLKQAAPVKYVDGAWLGHINKISTPFAWRRATKDAWQVMSEELGDGDLDKNHVKVYRDLMEEINAGIPEGDSHDFIHPRHDLDQPRVWKAAIAQLLVSLFPHEFLPEILGFNMSYEGLPLHLMKTVKELDELKLNSYYFVLHIAIDNADSGHSKMAMEAAIEYIEHERSIGGEDAAQQAWRRVQAGIILADGLPTTPESPSLKKPAVDSFPRNEREAEVVKIFQSKAPVAHKIHCSSRLKIGRHSLVDWLEPNAFASKQWQMDFLEDLSNMKPWVRKGDSYNSRLIRELSWEGKMFGSFTQTEVDAVKRWIDGMGPASSSLYWDFVGRPEVNSAEACQKQDVRVDYPVLRQIWPQGLSVTAPSSSTLADSKLFSGRPTNLDKLIPLWFAHPCLLENFVTVPAKVANALGSAVVRVLRAQSGFEVEGPGVAGMDEVARPHVVGLVELGLEMMRSLSLPEPSSLLEALHGRDEGFATQMLHFSMKPMQNQSLLIGLAWAFMQLHEAMAASDLLGEDGKRALADIAHRERGNLDLCLDEIKNDDLRWKDFCRGYNLGVVEIRSCFEQERA